jgi:hypothetical protein
MNNLVWISQMTGLRPSSDTIIIYYLNIKMPKALYLLVKKKDVRASYEV